MDDAFLASLNKRSSTDYWNRLSEWIGRMDSRCQRRGRRIKIFHPSRRVFAPAAPHATALGLGCIAQWFANKKNHTSNFWGKRWLVIIMLIVRGTYFDRNTEHRAGRSIDTLCLKIEYLHTQGMETGWFIENGGIQKNDDFDLGWEVLTVMISCFRTSSFFVCLFCFRYTSPNPASAAGEKFTTMRANKVTFTVP